MKCLLAAVVASVCIVGLAGCSSSNDDSADTAPKRQASAGQDCGNSPSTASAILIANRLEQEIRFEAGGVYCVQWSGTGNPGNYSGSVIPAGQTAYWGLEFGNTQRHAFTANFNLTGNGRTILRDPPLYVRFNLNNGFNEVSTITTSPASADASLTSGSYIVGDDAAGPIRIVTSAVLNPKDGSWTGSAGRAEKWGFLISLQNVK